MTRPIRAGIRLGPQDQSTGTGIGEQLRTAAAHWPSGVAVAALRDGQLFEAITVTAFMIVSLEPPLVLLSVNRQAAIVPLLEETQRCTISLLGADQAGIASQVADRMPTMRALFTADADPALAGATHVLVCRVQQTHAAGDHWLFVLEVERVTSERSAPALAYYERAYRTLE